MRADEHPADMRADYTIDQKYDQYLPEDHAIWAELFDRQKEVVKGRACREYLDGLAAFELDPYKIPNFERLSDIMHKRTGWRVVTVPGYLPPEVFFKHISQRQFPVTWWIRSREQMDYLVEPDVFHDVFGHLPLLLNPVFADYMHAFGQGGAKAITLDAVDYISRLYWYTVEFGLIQTDEGMRIYGGGIVSSKSETIYAVESETPNRIGFDLKRVMQTDFHIDEIQQTYFVIKNFEQLFDATRPDFTPLYRELKALPTYERTDVLPSDELFRL